MIFPGKQLLQFKIFKRTVFCKKRSLAVSSDLAVLFDVTCIVKETEENLAKSNFYVD